MNKVVSVLEAISQIKSGHTIAVGGFGLVGCPLLLIDALSEHPIDQLTIISNNLGEPGGKGIGNILLQNKIKKAIGSFFTSNIDAVRYANEGKLEIEIERQGFEKGASIRNKKYKLLEKRKYEVDDSFPQITQANFKEGRYPDAITHIQYTVDLDGIEYTSW